MPNDVLINKEKCTGCAICAKVCPVNVFDIKDKKSIATRSAKCMGCQLCEVECPVGAIKIERAIAKSASPWEKKTVPVSPLKTEPVTPAPSPSVAVPVSQVSGQFAQQPSTIVTPAATPVIPVSAPAPAVRIESTVPKVISGPESYSPPSFGQSAVPSNRPTQAPGVISHSPTLTAWEYPSNKKPQPKVDTSQPPAGVAQVLETPGETTGSTRKILTVVPDLCVNCRICELVCSLKHTGEFNPFKACVKITYNGHSGPYTPTICRHCRNAACEAACPTKALYYQDKIVLLDRDKCINCLECVRACPFAAIQVGPSGEIYKCDLCGGEPMCAKYCPPRPENTGGKISHPKASAIQYVEPHNVTAMRRQGLASSKK